MLSLIRRPIPDLQAQQYQGAAPAFQFAMAPMAAGPPAWQYRQYQPYQYQQPQSQPQVCPSCAWFVR